MKSLATTAITILLTGIARMSVAADTPDDQARYEAMHNTGKPFAVEFHADACLMCRALAPARRGVTPSPEFMGITLFVAKFDTERVLERSLGFTEQSSIEVLKEGARSKGDTQYDTLSDILRRVIP